MLNTYPSLLRVSATVRSPSHKDISAFLPSELYFNTTVITNTNPRMPRFGGWFEGLFTLEFGCCSQGSRPSIDKY